ncbi:MAG: alpha/beta hydrolase [Dehalococcoidia bacterium]
MSAGIHRGYVDTPKGQIHYQEAGEGRAILLLHQSPSSSRMWEPMLLPLARRGYRAVAMDYPGFGQSYKPETQPTLDDYIQSLIDVADALGIKEFDCLGHHTGATFALVLADRYPDRVGKSVSYGLAYLEPQYAERLANEPPTTFTEEGSEILRGWQRYWQNKQKRNQQGNVNVALRNLTDLVQLGENSGWAHNAIGKLDHEPILRRVTRPVLIVGGEHDRGLLPGSREAGKILKTGRFVELPGGTGDIYDEDPERLADVVDSFLREP